MESTYGNRRHDHESARREFASVITRALSRGGTVVISAFAIDRTAAVLHELATLRGDGTLPRHVPVHVDSPMALAAPDVHRDAVRTRSPAGMATGGRVLHHHSALKSRPWDDAEFGECRSGPRRLQRCRRTSRPGSSSRCRGTWRPGSGHRRLARADAAAAPGRGDG
ncbi:hypothetical protein [Streptomyces xanthophaeus]|uniref:hypothetical protein n=1 Tax=Streptomyces xanthophaeus TaxID=67385 RepID=UPI002649660F|nr:hypothetical protein [Streptomyces xanthophaeus]